MEEIARVATLLCMWRLRPSEALAERMFSMAHFHLCPDINVYAQSFCFFKMFAICCRMPPHAYNIGNYVHSVDISDFYISLRSGLYLCRLLAFFCLSQPTDKTKIGTKCFNQLFGIAQYINIEHVRTAQYVCVCAQHNSTRITFMIMMDMKWLHWLLK